MRNYLIQIQLSQSRTMARESGKTSGIKFLSPFLPHLRLGVAWGYILQERSACKDRNGNGSFLLSLSSDKTCLNTSDDK
jgi:hypothetical protein